MPIKIAQRIFLLTQKVVFYILARVINFAVYQLQL